MSKSSRNHPHLYLSNNQEFLKTVDYTSPRSGRTPEPLNCDRTAQAKKIEAAIGQAIVKAHEQLQNRSSKIAVGKPGFYLEFEVLKDNANVFEDLGNKQKKIELVSVKPSADQEGCVKATVFVPESATDFFTVKVEKYRDENTKKGNPKNAGLITRLENVDLGTVQSLFTDDLSLFPQNGQKIWWEVWLRRDQFENFQLITQRLNITIKSTQIKFPERTVVLAIASAEQMEQIIYNSDTVAELRIAKDTPSFFLNLSSIEQKEWSDDLDNLTLPPSEDSDAVTVCLLDTGVYQKHTLIEKGLDVKDLHTCDPTWGVGVWVHLNLAMSRYTHASHGILENSPLR